MKHKFIDKYSEFMLNETLKTVNIDKTIYYVSKELSLSKVNFSIEKIDNLIDFSYIPNERNDFNTELDTILNLFIDRFGWFPSSMKLMNKNNMTNTLTYDKDFLIKKLNNLIEINLTFEPKYDIENNIPDKLYHLTIQEFKNKINKLGLYPKSKSKKTKHLDRIYVCQDVEKCYNLINQMKTYYIYNNIKCNYKWMIYEIESRRLNIKIYKDPNYEGGYYLTENIHPNLIKIYDEE